MPTNFVAESWSYLAVDLVIVGIRIASRWHLPGFRKLSHDDFLMAIAAVKPLKMSSRFTELIEAIQLLYTAETATAYYVGAYWLGLANNRYMALPVSPESASCANAIQ
jgi:hypothetical protein